jgi:hypothetical protein
MLKSLASRFSEPSSWAGIAGMLAVLGLHLSPDVGQSIAYIGAGVAGLAAILIPEGK